MPVCNATLSYPIDLAERLLASPLLRFNEIREFDTGRIKQYRSAQKFRGFTFVINPRAGQVIVKGSWAKFHNHGQHNYTPYLLSDFVNDIAELSQLFNYDFSQGRIHGVEVGVNIHLDGLPQTYFSPDYLISRFICYKGRLPFLPMKTIRGAGSGVECCLTNYRIKVYDKGTQYHRPNSILRFEYDCNQAKELLPHDIRTLADLTIAHKLDQLGQKLQDLLADCVLLEPVDEYQLTAVERKLWARAERPLIWYELSRRQRTYQLARFRQLTQTYSTHRLQATLHKQMRQTWQQLTQRPLPAPTPIPPLTNQLSPINWHKFLVISWGKRYNKPTASTEVPFTGFVAPASNFSITSNDSTLSSSVGYNKITSAEGKVKALKKLLTATDSQRVYLRNGPCDGVQILFFNPRYLSLVNLYFSLPSLGLRCLFIKWLRGPPASFYIKIHHLPRVIYCDLTVPNLIRRSA